MKKIIQPLKGTRDFYPEIMATRTWLYNILREVSESFGYLEYEGPFLESIDLYAAKSGDELVNQQSFVFPDRGGDLITLRPELTPTLVRMIAQRQSQLVFPLRWWSWGPMWRYERPQKGRTREFFQWNLDLIGVDSPEADAEMAAVIANFFKKTGLTSNQVAVLVNNRRLMDAELASLAISQELRPNVSHLIDRRDKMKLDEWLAYGAEIGLDSQQLDGLQGLLTDSQLWQKSDELARFFKAINALGVQDYVRYEPNIIRGLDYYTGTVFEAKELEGDIRRSILGGGRYDNLMADVGGDPLPGVGFAMGDVVITLILEKAGLLPKGGNQGRSTVLVTVFDGTTILESYALAAELRQTGLKTACYPEAARLAKQFKYADRAGIRVAVTLGPDEIASGKVTIKDLASGSQETVLRSRTQEAIQKLLERVPPS
jgi:histidyl-tRNA synthetase